MARRLRLRHGEAHVREKSARAPLGNVTLRLDVWLGRRGSDGVEPQSLGQLRQLLYGHATIVPVKAVRIHEDGGPEVLRYEDAPEPVPGTGQVLVRLQAASLNHLDLWVRKGLPSVPKPRILGADGAGLVEALGQGVDGFEPGQRVVLNPGIEHGATITVIGEHTDGTHAELIAVPATNVYALPDELSFEDAAAFPLVFETAFRMLVTRASLAPGEWVLVWGIGGGVATAALAIAKALGANVVVTSSSDEKLARAAELGADAVVNHATGDVPEAVKQATGGRGADLVVEHVGEATWKTSLQVVRPGGRIVVCGATSGPNPPAGLHRIWWKQLTIYGSTMGTRDDFEGAYELVKNGRAKPVVDEVFALADARAAHERLEAGEQLGKIVLRIPE
jgi:NADPH:quinone reductase-like Zn-dependent oxidoreductase